MFDNSSKATSNTGETSLSWSHTQGALGTKGLLVVAAGGEDTSGAQTNQQITGVTYNGVAMTKVDGGDRTDSHSTSGVLYELHGTSLPAAAGTYTITVSYRSNSCEANAAVAATFKNIKPQVAEAHNNKTQNGSASISNSLTTLTKKALLVVAYSSQNTPNATTTTGETRVDRAVPGSAEQMETCLFYDTIDTPGSHTTTLTTSNPETEVMVMASFEVAKIGGGFFHLTK